MNSRRRGWGWPATVSSTWLMLLFLVLPMAVVVPVSLTPHRYLSMPSGEISFRHYVNLFTNEAWLSSIWHSTLIASVSTILAAILGTAFAIGCWRIASRAAEIAWMLMLTPIIVPPIVHALGFYRFWIQLGIVDTFAGVIIAHVLIGMPFVVITVSASLANFDPRLEQAARNLGATPAQAVRMVILPSIRPGVLAGAVFAFIMSWDEIVVVLFITSRAVYTLPRKMWDGIQENVDPTIAAIATVLVVLTFACVLAGAAMRSAARRRSDPGGRSRNRRER